MTDRHAGPSSRSASWLVGCLLGGWLVVYNAMRLSGSSPAAAAWPSLAAGAAAGLAVFALGLLLVRRLERAGRVVHRGPLEVPAPERLEPAQRDALALAWPALGVLAAVALVLGAYLAREWGVADERAATTLVLAIWNIVFGLWLGGQALRLRQDDADGIDSVPLGCGLTAVLAGVGLSRDLAVPGQVALIVLCGIAGVLAALVVWRIEGAHGPPLAAGVVAVAAGLSILLPVVL